MPDTARPQDSDVSVDRTPFGVFGDHTRLKLIHRLIIKIIMMKQGRTKVPEPLILGTYKKELFGKHFAGFMQRAMIESDYYSRVEAEMFAGFTATRLNCVY